MANVKIINKGETLLSPAEGKLYITEEERIIMGVQVNHVIQGVYLDTGRLITIGISMASPVPSTWKIELSND
jgi:hypothetical protein